MIICKHCVTSFLCSYSTDNIYHLLQGIHIILILILVVNTKITIAKDGYIFYQGLNWFAHFGIGL